jgi:hypothetical protein
LWFIYAFFKLLNWFSWLSLLALNSFSQFIYNFIIWVFVIARIICAWVLSSARTLIKITNNWRLDSLIFNHTFRFIYQSLSNLSCSFLNIILRVKLVLFPLHMQQPNLDTRSQGSCLRRITHPYAHAAAIARLLRIANLI